MPHTPRRLAAHLIAALALLFAVAAAPAQRKDADNADDTPKPIELPTPAVTIYPEHPVARYHSVTVNGEPVHYVSVTSLTTLLDDERTPGARVFSIAYHRLAVNSLRELRAWIEQHNDVDPHWTPVIDNLDNTDILPLLIGLAVTDALANGRALADMLPLPAPGSRPLTFSFNGGPGSSSVWLHLGLFGPQKIKYADDFGNPGPPPYALEANPFSLLDVSDFVFIDPVSTGYSRAEPGTQPGRFHGVTGDLTSIAEFIRRWLGDNTRWASPLFVAGESYGTFRAAGLAAELWDRHHIPVSGIILISTVLDFLTLRTGDGNDLPYLLYMPNFTAAAHFHNRLSPRLQALPVRDAVAEAEAFALGDYALALMQGDALPQAQLDLTAARLAELTGLSVEYVRRANLRISQPRFCKELLRDQGLVVGRFDARFTGRDTDDAGETYEEDPSYSAIRAIYTTTMNQYLRQGLGFDSDLDYRILTGAVRPWSYGNAGESTITSHSPRLRAIIHEQPYLRVFQASGLYDLATPAAAADYTLDHLMLRPERRSAITTRYYGAGHMMYLRRDDLAQLSADLRAWYPAPTPAP